MIRERQPMSYSGIFFDSADLGEFESWIRTGILGGATTNPAILKKVGVLNVPAHIGKMIEIAGKGFPISIEIPDTRWPVQDMIELGRRYKDMFPDNAVIKVPMDPRRPTVSFEVMHILAGEGIRVNATFGMTGGQLIYAAEALRCSKAEGDNYLSFFWNRRIEAIPQIIDEEIEKLKKIGQEKGKNFTEDDQNQARSRLLQQVYNAQQTLTEVLEYLVNHGLNKARVLVASVRTPWDVDQAFSLGADVVTISPELLKKWQDTKRGVETSDEFNAAYDFVKDQVKLI